MNSNLDFKVITLIGSAKTNESNTKHKDNYNNLCAMLCDSDIIHDCSGFSLFYSIKISGETHGRIF